MLRTVTSSDRLVEYFDNALKSLTPGTVKARQANPSHTESIPELSKQERQHIAGLMRINHAGEVCAQGLYQGQALTAKLNSVKQSMSDAADEELDHLAWCEERLQELDARTSLLNPGFYGLSFGLGALAGLAGDKWSLGFVAATEDQVSAHLENHLDQIDNIDPRSTKILERMLEDERRHAEHAIEAGGVKFHPQVKNLMTAISALMTKTAYRI